MVDEPDLRNFDDVWRRVCEQSERPEPEREQVQPSAQENMLCLVKQTKKSCAVRFLQQR